MSSDSFKNLHGSYEFVNEKTGQPESFSERTDRVKKENAEKEKEKSAAEKIITDALIEARIKAGIIKGTQKQQRELKRKQRQAEEARAKLTQEDIRAKCGTDGVVKVTMEDMKNAFPSLISQIDGNAFRTQIDNKVFHEFLLSNNLTFSLPDFVFKRQN